MPTRRGAQRAVPRARGSSAESTALAAYSKVSSRQEEEEELLFLLLLLAEQEEEEESFFFFAERNSRRFAGELNGLLSTFIYKL